MGLIFFASSIPGNKIPSLFSFQDIAFHLCVYAALAFLFIRALKISFTDFSLARAISITIIFGIIYGLGDEFHQSFVAGRDASLFDLFIDTAGTFAGALIYR